MNKKIVWLAIALVILVGVAYAAFRLVPGAALAPTQNSPDANKIMSEAEARGIAEKSCVKGGEALGPGAYNPSSKTWWFDANLNATKPGCNPACVVSETKTAEINWRCTGAIPPEPTDDTGHGTSCTMEAKICPDGSSVGRTLPNCEFSPCPTSGAATECPAEFRNAEVCNQIYNPVCALVQIQCIKAPCNPINQTFPNSCEACRNPLVKSFILGKCAK